MLSAQIYSKGTVLLRIKARVSNLFRAYSAFPEIGMANFRRLSALLTQGTLRARSLRRWRH